MAEQLQKQIKEGKLKEGDKLPTEPELMKVFGVGRSTIREAVKMLLNKGYISVQQGRGTFVESQTPVNESFEQRFKRADIQDLYDVRKILEAAIAERAALHRTEQDLKDIQEYTMKRKVSAKAGLLKECFEADICFHVAVAKATHNEILFELYRSAAMHLQKAMFIFMIILNISWIHNHYMKNWLNILQIKTFKSIRDCRSILGRCERKQVII